eukprot:CAMPEP_0115596958 /NCGR_PEP_ID=MMETSP0272-20121206/13102_1 /TAXON_ID=71861 /ORGANISM="Scrippsiella trochoidea, Strain CCMP3099" /LENGTH=194 /DNA_ID=CAMNT_0003032309 /DNA_START=214 /DNA_END=795 /DNA_ORIENTATION=-
MVLSGCSRWGTIAAVAAGIAPASLQLESSAEVPRLLEQSLRRYSKRLQRTADEFVFYVRPMISAGNWTGLSSKFKEDPFPSNAIRIVDLVTSGNEDFLEGVDGASANLNVACQQLAAAAAAADSAAALKAWEDAVGSLNTVMSAANKVRSEEQSLQDLPPLATVPSNVEEYSRTLADVVRWCGPLDGLYGGDFS